jgi:hypothetical protein
VIVKIVDAKIEEKMSETLCNQEAVFSLR